MRIGPFTFFENDESRQLQTTADLRARAETRHEADPVPTTAERKAWAKANAAQAQQGWKDAQAANQAANCRKSPWGNGVTVEVASQQKER